jgi:hypothetical protein
MKQLAAAGTQERKYVLEVGRGARKRSERGRIKRAPRDPDERHTRSTARDLEAPRADVLVRNSVTCQVKDRPKQDCAEPRSGRRADCGTCRNVK